MRARIAPTVATGTVRCCLGPECFYAEEVDGKILGGFIRPGQKWHLDHTPDRRGYRGVAHEKCNTSEGARRGNALRGLRRSRRW